MIDYLHADTKISASAKGRNRTGRGASVVRELDALGGVWAGRIRIPGRKGDRNDGFTIQQATFVRSLRPLLDMPIIANVKSVQIAVLLNAYWEGIAKVLPEPFDPANSPQNYLVQKDQGVAVLHSVLPQVIEVLPSWGRSLEDPIAYADAMHDLPTLSGEIVTENGVELVSDGKFWLSGAMGAASQFSGDEGYIRLSNCVRALIPQPDKGLEI